MSASAQTQTLDRERLRLAVHSYAPYNGGIPESGFEERVK